MGGDIGRSSQSKGVSREHNDWYRLLFDYANDAIFVYRRTPEGDPDALLDVNDAACRMTGYTRQELLGMTMLDVSAPERYANYPLFKDKLDVEGHIVTETVKLTKDGRRIAAELSSHLFELDGIPTVLSIVRDITERKKADSVLKESEWWHRMIVDSANDAIFVYRQTPMATGAILLRLIRLRVMFWATAGKSFSRWALPTFWIQIVWAELMVYESGCCRRNGLFLRR